MRHTTRSKCLAGALIASVAATPSVFAQNADKAAPRRVAP